MTSSSSQTYWKTVVHVTGIVQGVGFRPTVYRYATEAGLGGFVLNNSDGVFVTLLGDLEKTRSFVSRLQEQPPPLARVETLDVVEQVQVEGQPALGFAITSSEGSKGRTTLISPDIASCDDCVTEMNDPADKRYRYPFLNCTNCGPRYTIIADIPYDRPLTTMSEFPMCPFCRREYEDPLDRRFHAQPTCCPECGPELTLLNSKGEVLQCADPVAQVLAALAEGQIVAIKGLGGYHLACNPRDDEAVALLRARKRRDEKPLAVMARDETTAETLAILDPVERRLVASRQRPIVLLEKRQPFPLSPLVAPGNRWIGVMLPYTPLHHLLLQGDLDVLVMTSANVSDEPIVKGNLEAVDRLGEIADCFLVHNRRILCRVDDSVMRVAGGRAMHLRRSRGFVPVPVELGRSGPPVLAVGAELKSTICVTRGTHAFVSQHIGDLEDERAWDFFAETVSHLLQMLAVDPAIVVHDLHPEYLSTRHARELSGVELLGVQHHHAHILSCMAEHRLLQPVIGLALDGTGWGPDGTIWGGEILAVKGAEFTRLGHFKPLPLPGNTMAIREPWRMALSYLHDSFGGRLDDSWSTWASWFQNDSSRQLWGLLDRGHRFHTSSGAGRLFEAVSAMLGVRTVNTFEGQAAMELEMLAAPSSDARPLPYALHSGSHSFVLDFGPTVRELATALGRGAPRQSLAYAFHLTVAQALVAAAEQARQMTGLGDVVVSGGVFQNDLLCKCLLPALDAAGFQCFSHSLVPPNDGGISLGQAYFARLREEG